VSGGGGQRGRKRRFFSKKKVLLGSFFKEDVAIQLSRATNSAALDCFVGDASSQ